MTRDLKFWLKLLAAVIGAILASQTETGAMLMQSSVDALVGTGN